MCLNIYNKKARISEKTQGIIQYFRKNIFLSVIKKNGQNMNQYLKDILEQEQGSLNSIIIFDLQGGLPLYYSSNELNLNYTLFGDNDIGEALKDFENIKQVKKALDCFGKATKSGELNYSIFKLAQAQLMVYFDYLPDTTVAICFITFSKDVTLGKLVSSGKNNIEKIKNMLKSKK